MHLLIIGGTGLLSAAVAAEALKRGLGVTMVNRGSRPIPAGAELVKADKDDLAQIAARLEGRRFDAVMDFLCYTDAQTAKSFRFYRDYAKQYFFISSCAVYDSRLPGVCDEEFPKVNPVWDYSRNKWAGEEHLRALQRGTDTEITIIRPAITYGDTRIPYGIAPAYGYHWTLAARILAGKPVLTWNGGKNRCNMMRVEDFAVGVIGLVGNPAAYGEAFNVCGDEAPSFRSVLDALSEYLGKEVVTVDVDPEFYAQELPARAGEILGGRAADGIYSNAKIKALVPEFRQTLSLREGLKMTLDAYQSHNYYHGIGWSFDGETDRIIRDWCRKNGTAVREYNTHFVDYLRSAKSVDRIKYYLFRARNHGPVHGLLSLALKLKGGV